MVALSDSFESLGQFPALRRSPVGEIGFLFHGRVLAVVSVNVRHRGEPAFWASYTAFLDVRAGQSGWGHNEHQCTPAGSGKAAAEMQNRVVREGWRLFSDEEAGRRDLVCVWGAEQCQRRWDGAHVQHITAQK